MRSSARTTLLAQGVCVVALAGMAYCHIKDVGMKFDEHVYYMATLFLCNIVASLLLSPAVVAFGRRGDRRAPAVWAAAGALAILTIAGFLWSRTVGFPQMQDHVGEWDGLGLASLAFEAVIVLVSVTQLRASRAESPETTLTTARATAEVLR
jgi:peptidoglycan/LPS O-acetylase OafA/YrhL